MSAFCQEELGLAKAEGAASYRKGYKHCPFSLPALVRQFKNGYDEELRKAQEERAKERAQAHRKARLKWIDKTLKDAAIGCGEEFSTRTIADALYPRAIKERKDGEPYNAALGAARKAMEEHPDIHLLSSGSWCLIKEAS